MSQKALKGQNAISHGGREGAGKIEQCLITRQTAAEKFKQEP
jgi:hypothetical protein